MRVFRSTLSLAVPLILLSFTALRAQGPSVLVSNDFRYGVGRQFDNETERKKEYLENMLATRVFMGDFTLGFRLEIDKPREFGRDTIGLKEYYAEFRRDGLAVRGGTFYHQVGRGMVMNTFESRPIGFDTQTEGVRMMYDSPEFSATAWGGILTSPDITNPRRLEEYLIRGAGGEARPLEWLGVGGSYMAASGRRTSLGFARAFDAYLREAWLRLEQSGVSFYGNYAEKRTDADSATLAANETTGRGGYGAYTRLGYTGEGFSVGFEMKDYRFDLVPPNIQVASSRPTRALPFQNMPTLLPVHDKTLLARNPHAPDFSDELGFQFESIVNPAEDVTLTLVANGGSRHNAWEHDLDSSGTPTDTYHRLNAKPLSFAELSDNLYSPYWEVFLHGEYEPEDADYSFAAGLQRRSNVDLPNKQTTRVSSVMLEGTFDLTKSDGLHAILELQRAFDSKKITGGDDSLGIAASDGTYNNGLLTLEYSHSPRWAVNTRIEVSTTDQEEKGRHVWPVVGATYRIGTQHTLGIQYGAERGGVVCTGGVCRFINPFQGFRLSLSSKL